MLNFALLQVDAAAATWVGPTMAISLAVIAASFVILGVIAVLAAFRMSSQLRQLTRTMTHVDAELRALLGTARRVMEQTQDLMVLVKHEAGAFAQTSRRVRGKVVRGINRIEDRLQDLEALYDVVHEEVEDTALDAAAALRSVRTGGGMIGRVRRMLVPGR